MSRYQGRHAPRHARPRSRSAAAAALRRPAVSGGLALVVLGTGAAGYSSASEEGPASAAAFSVSPQAESQASEDAVLRTEDSARIATERTAALAAANVNDGKAQEKARVAAAAAAKARKEAQRRAARAAERKRIIADAVKDPKGTARVLMGDYGFGADQWGCLEQLWIGESGWKHTATNASSGAYGIPQALPASKMATAGSDWRTNPATQIKWGLKYIKDAYGTPCSALGAWNSRYPHWY